MCLMPDLPKAQGPIDPTNRAAAAAADAALLARGKAQGFGASLNGFASFDSNQPSLARQMLGAG